MNIVITAITALVVAVLINYFYWKPKFKQVNEKLFNTQKSYYRSVDVARKLRKEILNSQEWMKLLQGEG